MNTSIRYDEKMLFFFGKKKHDGAENITTILGQFSELEKGSKALSTQKTANFHNVLGKIISTTTSNQFFFLPVVIH